MLSTVLIVAALLDNVGPFRADGHVQKHFVVFETNKMQQHHIWWVSLLLSPTLTLLGTHGNVIRGTDAQDGFSHTGHRRWNQLHLCHPRRREIRRTHVLRWAERR